MVKTDNNAKFYKADRIEEVVYHRQASDYFDRFIMELGRITTQQGFPAFTRFQAWCHAPTLKHPEFTLKIQLSNKKGGSVFAQMPVSEFDQWLGDLLEWRKKFHKEIEVAIATSLELRKRGHLHTKLTDVLSDINIPASLVEQALEEQSFIPKPSPKKVKDVQNYDFNYIVQEFLRIYSQWTRATNEQEKEFYFNEMRLLMPNNEDAINHLRDIIIDGFHPKQFLDAYISKSNALEGIERPISPEIDQDDNLTDTEKTEDNSQQDLDSQEQTECGNDAGDLQTTT